MSARPDVELTVRAVLHYLDRASDSWQNGNPREAGPLHWPIAVAEARRALEVARRALAEGREPPGVDVLANHANLRAAVQASDLSDAHARALAAARDARAIRTELGR